MVMAPDLEQLPVSFIVFNEMAKNDNSINLIHHFCESNQTRKVEEGEK